jgi:hypothetical protein
VLEQILAACAHIGMPPPMVELYTEVPEGNASLVVRGGSPGINGRIRQPKRLLPQHELNDLSGFDAIPRLTRFVNEPMLATFDRMIRCDVLVAVRFKRTQTSHTVTRSIVCRSSHACFRRMLGSVAVKLLCLRLVSQAGPPFHSVAT